MLRLFEVSHLPPQALRQQKHTAHLTAVTFAQST
jgi:hypothetical protein